MGRIIYAILALAFCFSINVKADNVKIYAILFCNTNDKNIGESCKSDQERFVNEIGLIETAIGCDEDLQVFIGNECTKPNLERALSNINCGKNDIVFFYYSGHGAHAKADHAKGWLPQMCLNYKSYDQDKFVPVTYVRDRLATKGARLNVIMTDCCNNNVEWVTVKGLLSQQKDTPVIEEINVAGLKKLFYESKGTVIMTSSKRGQVSYGPREGGCFSTAFWDEMFRIEQGKGVADWETLLRATVSRTLKSTNNKQEPAYKIDINNSYANNITNISNNVVVISAGEKELGDALKQIVSPRYSRIERCNMIDGIVGRLFDSNASVLLVGRDLKTNVGRPSNIGSYLEELALSKRVKGINIVRATKGSSGKYSQIVISEIR